MKMESTGRSAEGVPAWVVAGSVGLALAAATAIVVRSAGGASATDRPGASVEGVVAADDGDVAVESTAPVVKPAPRGGATAILASIPARSVADPRAEAIDRARREIDACRERYRAIHDYTCVFHKIERVDGKLVRPHVMAIKVRTEPFGIYLKFVTPDKGREAIFEPGRNSGKIVFHDVGLGRLIAGTLLLDPHGSMAMDENRHPVSDAGIGNLIDTLAEKWAVELDPAESVVEIHPHAKVGDRPCTLIETVHPDRGPAFMFHKVKVYIDREHGLPVRFEAYDWPQAPGGAPELVEEYTYADLKTDVGLTDLDFSAANPRYEFGRF